MGSNRRKQQTMPKAFTLRILASPEVKPSRVVKKAYLCRRISCLRFPFFGWIGAAYKVLGHENTEAHHTNILNPRGSTNTSEEAQPPSYPPLAGLE